MKMTRRKRTRPHESSGYEADRDRGKNLRDTVTRPDRRDATYRGIPRRKSPHGLALPFQFGD